MNNFPKTNNSRGWNNQEEGGEVNGIILFFWYQCNKESTIFFNPHNKTKLEPSRYLSLKLYQKSLLESVGVGKCR